MATLLGIALLALGGCALVPPGKGTLEGTHTAALEFKVNAALTLKRDGTYERQVSFFYDVPLVIVTEHGKEPPIYGWVNRETGTWTMADRIVRLETDAREIQNPKVEKEYFDDVRSYPVTYRWPQGWALVYPKKDCVLMKRAPEATGRAQKTGE